jgi:hypothetical protein
VSREPNIINRCISYTSEFPPYPDQENLLSGAYQELINLFMVINDFVYYFWKNFESNADKVAFTQVIKEVSDS